MKEKSFIIIFFLMISLTVAGQTNVFSKYEKVQKKSIFIFSTLNDTEDKLTLQYFIQNANDKEPLDNKETFGLKNGYSNIHMLWLNPLKYEVKWQDSTFADPRDKSVSDFVSLLTSQFGSAVTDLNKAEDQATSSFFAEEERNNAALEAKDPKKVTLKPPKKGFNSIALMNLYFQLRKDFEVLEKNTEDVIRVNQVLKDLESLDTLHSSRNIVNEIKELFLKLYNVDQPLKVSSVIDEINGKKWNDFFKKIDENTVNIEEALGKELINSEELLLLNTYAKNIIKDYLAEVKNSRVQNENLSKDLQPFIVKMKSSVATPSVTDAQSTDRYYTIRGITLDEGKGLTTAITISMNIIEENTLKLTKKSIVNESKISFVKHDPVHPFISTGVFYSDTEIKGYGFKPGDGDKLVVTQDDIKKNNPVTALFLNFQVLNSSKYFAPLVQLGVDPTKKRPFLMAGGGFSVPVAKFAITGGVIWTWEPSLKTLNPGDTIDSSAKLEEDITYKFTDLKRAGGYLGIQYNFK